MEKFKVNIKNSTHSEQVQQKLFEMGYLWACASREIQYTDKGVLFAESNGSISYSSVEYSVEEQAHCPLMELVQKFEFELVPDARVTLSGDYTQAELLKIAEEMGKEADDNDDEDEDEDDEESGEW